jgi:hypothetical protein
MRYRFAQHKLSQEIWATRIDEGGRVVAICGPLPLTDVSDSLLPEYVYRSDPKELADFNEHPDDFTWEMLPDAVAPD